MSDTPETGSVPTTDSAALALISQKLAPPSGETPSEGEGRSGEDNPQGAPAGEGNEAEAPEESQTEGESEGESQEADQQLPETLDDLSARTGIPAEKLRAVKLTVKIDGKDEVVTLDEALNGYSRQSDYTRKSEEVARSRKEFEALTERAAEKWEGRIKNADALIQYATEKFNLLANPDEMARLFEMDRDAYERRKFEIERTQADLNRIYAARQQMEQDRNADMVEKTARFRREQQEYLKGKFPELRTAEGQKAFETEAYSYLKEVGYDEQSIAAHFAGAYNARDMEVLRDAMAYRKLKAAQKNVAQSAKVNKAPKLAKPGATRQSPDERITAQDAAFNKFRKNPTNQNALERIKAIIR